MPRSRATLRLALIAGISTLPIITAAAAADGTSRSIDGFAHPESVLIDGNTRYVSNIGEKLDPLGKDGDGFISLVDASGGIETLKAFPATGKPLDAPKGMGLIDGVLYVADIDRVVGFDLVTRAAVFEAALPTGKAPVLLNDILVVDDTLYVSETLGGKIYRLDRAAKRLEALPASVPGANGMAYDEAGRALLVVSIGPDFKGGFISRLALVGASAVEGFGPRAAYDGIAVDRDGTLIVSDWVSIDPSVPGRLIRLAPDGAEKAVLDTGGAITGPADFARDPASGEIWVPATMEGRVQVFAPQRGS